MIRIFNYEFPFDNSLVQEPGWQRMKEAIKEIQKTTQSHNIKFLPIIFPFRSQLNNLHGGLKPQADLLSFFRENQIDSLDLYSDFSNKKRASLYLDKVGVHLSEYGHQVAAQALYGKIESLLKINN